MLGYLRNNKKSNKIKSFIIFLVLTSFILFSSSFVSAIGIGPGSYDVTYAPGYSKNLDFIVLNNGGKLMTYNIYVTDKTDNGSLKSILACNKDKITIQVGQTGSFSCMMTLPNYLAPGFHEVRVGAIEATVATPGMIAVLSAVESRISISVPYEGFYPSLSLSSNNTKRGEQVPFTVFVKNWGNKEGTASANIDVYSPSGEKIGNVKTDEKFIEAMGNGQLYAEWLANVEPGKYSAVARTIADGKELNSSGKFVVGDLLLGILNLSSDVTANEIGKFETTIESLWPEAINFDLQIEVLNSAGSSMGSRKDNFVINAWGFKTFTTIWDNKISEPGNYTAKVRVTYDNGKVAEKSFPFMVKGKSVISGFKFTTEYIVIIILAVMIFLLLIMFLALILFNRRKKDKDKDVKTSHHKASKKHK